MTTRTTLLAGKETFPLVALSQDLPLRTIVTGVEEPVLEAAAAPAFAL
jgi:hypothetical protein